MTPWWSSAAAGNFVESESSGRNLGKKEGYESEKKARQRLHLVDYFKSMKGKPRRGGGTF